jgi:hypothetical protein
MAHYQFSNPLKLSIARLKSEAEFVAQEKTNGKDL